MKVAKVLYIDGFAIVALLAIMAGCVAGEEEYLGGYTKDELEDLMRENGAEYNCSGFG